MYFSGFEYLAQEMLKIRELKGRPTEIPENTGAHYWDDRLDSIRTLYILSRMRPQIFSATRTQQVYAIHDKGARDPCYTLSSTSPEPLPIRSSLRSLPTGHALWQV